MEFNFKNDDLLTIKSKKPEYITDCIKGDVFHDTYIDYLYQAYCNHYGVIIKPDYIWFTILNEISRKVKENPEAYRKIFTDSDDKKEVVVLTNDPLVMPINILLDAIFKLIPAGLNKEDIVLNFSTSTASSKIAFSASFLEAASPFYCYGMAACGFNKLKVLGTVHDYIMITDAILNLREVFIGTPLMDYYTKVLKVLSNIANQFNYETFWKDMFYTQQCGSGHATFVLKGWFADLFDFEGYKIIHSFPKHVAIVKYKNLDNNNLLQMHVGVFSSTIDDGYLIPDFEFGVKQQDKNLNQLNK